MNLTIDCIIGIDPGSNGALATWRPNALTTTIEMPKNLFDLRKYFQYIKTISENPLVIIEKVQQRPDDMQFGKAFGVQKMLNAFQQLKDILTVEEIPFIQVHPMTWQSTLSLRAKAECPDEVNEAVNEALAKRRDKGQRTGKMQLIEITDRATKRVRKNRYKRAAQRFYPEVKATLTNADALLLMHFGRLKLQADPQWLVEHLPPHIQHVLEV